MQLVLAQGDNHVLGLQIGVDNAALTMEVVQADQDLLGHSADKWQRNALIVISFHDLEEVDAEDLKHHDEVLSVGTRMDEGIQ